MAVADLLDLTREPDRLKRLAEYEILDTPQEPVFDDLAAFAADACQTTMSALTFLDKEREWFKSNIGVPVTELPRTQALSAHAIRQGDILVVPDTRGDTRFADNPLVTGEPHVRFFAGAPFFSADGTPLGALCVLGVEAHELSPRQLKTLGTLSQEVARLLELRREIYLNRRYSEQDAAELEKLRLRLDAESETHRHIQAEQRRQQQQLSDAERIAHLGSWQWDIPTNRVTWSHELYRIFGRRPGEFKATYAAYLNYVHPDDRARANELVQKALTGSGLFMSEYRIVRADGVVRILKSSGEVVYDAQKRPRRMVGCCHDITERRQAEKGLESTVSLLNATLEATADGILVADLNGRIKRWNQKFLDVGRVPEDVVVDSEHISLVGNYVNRLQNSDAFLERLREIYKHPEVDSFDVLELKDGRVFERYSQPQRVGEQIVGRVWSFRDVTSRVRAERTMRQSEERYRSLVIATTQVVWTANAAGEIVDGSPSWEQFTGQTCEQMRGYGWLNVIHPKDRPRMKQTWSHTVSTRTVYKTECRVRRVDGEWRDIAVRAVPVFETDGTVREWVGVCIDETERKKAQHAVLEERDFSQALINSLPGIFYVLDEEGLNLRWNKNLELITEYSTAEIGRMRALDFVVPEERTLIADRVRKVFLTGESNVEITMQSKSGKRLPFYCTGVLVTINGKPHLVGVGVDVSEACRAREEIKTLNKMLEKRVEERTAELQRTNRDLESFSYTASHDLRSPIRAMVGFARAVLEDSGASIGDEGRAYLERIMQAGDRMLQLVDDLLEYSRIGQAALHIRAIPLCEFFKQLSADFSLQLKAIGGEIDVAQDIPAVNGDPTLLNQIFSNLLQNAIAYRRKDVPLKVAVTWTRENSYILINVTDNGIGIQEQYFDKIFEIFQRVHRKNEYGGTGIGLANVKKATEALGGKVTVKSTLGLGTTFTVSFPLAS